MPFLVVPSASGGCPLFVAFEMLTPFWDFVFGLRRELVLCRGVVTGKEIPWKGITLRPVSLSLRATRHINALSTTWKRLSWKAVLTTRDLLGG